MIKYIDESTVVIKNKYTIKLNRLYNNFYIYIYN